MKERKNKKPKIKNIKTVAKSRLFTIESVRLEFPNGNQRAYERFCSSNHRSVVIVPILDGSLILVREYNVGIEKYELSFPKGLINAGETIDEAVNRELKEEVGYGADTVQVLSSMTVLPNYFSGTTDVVVAKDLYPSSLPGDEPEPLRKVYWPLRSILSLLNEPNFRETRNTNAVFFVYFWLTRQRIFEKKPS